MLKSIGQIVFIFSVLFISTKMILFSLNISDSEFTSQNDTKKAFATTKAGASETMAFTFNPDVIHVSKNGTKKCMNKCHWHYVVCTTSEAQKMCRSLYKKCAKNAAIRCQN